VTVVTEVRHFRDGKPTHAKGRLRNDEKDPSVDEAEEQRDEWSVWEMGMEDKNRQRQEVGGRTFLGGLPSRQP
jgi:hypothetical protein